MDKGDKIGLEEAEIEDLELERIIGEETTLISKEE